MAMVGPDFGSGGALFKNSNTNCNPYMISTFIILPQVFSYFKISHNSFIIKAIKYLSLHIYNQVIFHLLFFYTVM